MVISNYKVLLGSLLIISVVVLIYQIQVVSRNQDNATMKPSAPPVPPKDYWIQLWRPRKMHAHVDRILKQRKWIQHMALKKAWDILPPKNILVFDANSSFYSTKGQVTCLGGFQMESRCKITHRRSSDTAFGKLRSFDAIVTPHDWVYLNEIRIPFPSMKHVFYSLESPEFCQKVKLNENNIILASYSYDADIPIPYGKWVPNKAFTTVPRNSSDKNFAEGKTKLVAMLVSNCNDKNGRLKYARELNNFIPVDIYGKCGPLNCSVSNEDCFSMIKEHYKFYLAFENSNCRDYMTEKLFTNALQNNVIPIVMGAHPDDYKALAPENSYIHIEDFDSPKSLARYLKSLHENDTSYNQYFKWKERGHFVETLSDFFCRVCGLLYYSDHRPPAIWSPGSTYKNMYNCLPQEQWYWNQ